MSLASDIGRALVPKRRRGKTLPKRLPRGFGDELMAREYAQAVARHQGALAELRAARRLRSRELVAHCRERVAAVRAAAWDVYRSAQEAARARRRGEVASARETCKAERITELAPVNAQIAGERAALDERRRERRAYQTRERQAAAKERKRAPKKATSAAEERGAVRYALEQEAPELVSLWDRVGASMRAGPRRTLREAFLDWAQEHPEEVQAARDEAARAAERETIAEMEREQREAYEAAQAAQQAPIGSVIDQAQAVRNLAKIEPRAPKQPKKAPRPKAPKAPRPERAAPRPERAELRRLLRAAEENEDSARAQIGSGARVDRSNAWKQHREAHAQAIRLAARILPEWGRFWADLYPLPVPEPLDLIRALALAVGRGDPIDRSLLVTADALGLVTLTGGQRGFQLTSRGQKALDSRWHDEGATVAWLANELALPTLNRERAERLLARNLLDKLEKAEGAAARAEKRRARQVEAEGVPF